MLIRMVDIEKLTQFLAEAVAHTYAGGGKEVLPPWTPGFKELEYPKGGWKKTKQGFYYRDSYAGFFLAPGREVIFLEGVPVWCRVYSGGMELPKQGNSQRGDANFAREIFAFLKQALRQFDPNQPFRRGPDYLAGKMYQGWEYASGTKGDMRQFVGHEEIRYKGKRVFSQNYSGCLILHE